MHHEDLEDDRHSEEYHKDVECAVEVADTQDERCLRRSRKWRAGAFYARWWGGDDAFEMYKGIFGKSYW